MPMAIGGEGRLCLRFPILVRVVTRNIFIVWITLVRRGQAVNFGLLERTVSNGRRVSVGIHRF